MQMVRQSKDLKLPYGQLQEMAKLYGVSRWTIQRLWKSVKRDLMLKQAVKVGEILKGKVGKKPTPLVV